MPVEITITIPGDPSVDGDPANRLKKAIDAHPADVGFYAQNPPSTAAEYKDWTARHAIASLKRFVLAHERNEMRQTLEEQRPKDVEIIGS